MPQLMQSACNPGRLHGAYVSRCRGILCVRVSVDALAMASEHDLTHYFTGGGALCGAQVAYRWTIVRSRTSCAACRELLEAEEQREAETAARRRTPLARIRSKR